MAVLCSAQPVALAALRPGSRNRGRERRRMSAAPMRALATLGGDAEHDAMDARIWGLSRRDMLGLGGLAVVISDPTMEASAGSGSFYDFTVKYKGEDFKLDAFADKNRNYPGLRDLYEKYHDSGLEILAFPANNFGGQAPGTSEEERDWAIRKFGFEFPVMDKIMVKDRPTPQWDGPTEISPVYKFLKSFPETKGEIEWNYVKFLVSRDGVPLRRYGPGFDPASMERDVKYALERKLPLPKKQQAIDF